MKNRILDLVGPLFVAILVTSLNATPAFVAPETSESDDKITVEQLLAKHLDSIGSDEARKGLKSITAVGTAQATFKGRGEGRTQGIAVFASQGEKNMIGMKFNTADYPFERVGYDGDKFAAGFVRPGEYTILGQFMRLNERTFRSGILGGSMSTSWELLNYGPSSGKLKAKGTTKIGDIDALKFDFSPKKGSDLDVSFYFDAATFRHIRTEYKRTIAAAQGVTVDTSSRQSETRYKMVEDFSNYQKAGDLTLPHTYRLYLELLTGNGTTSYTWDVAIEKYTFNQSLDDSEFEVAKN